MGGLVGFRFWLDGCEIKSSTPGLDPRTVQSVASRSVAKRQVCNIWISCLFWSSFFFWNAFLKTLLFRVRHNVSGWCHSCALCAKMWTGWVTCKFTSPSEQQGALKRSKAWGVRAVFISEDKRCSWTWCIAYCTVRSGQWGQLTFLWLQNCKISFSRAVLDGNICDVKLPHNLISPWRLSLTIWSLTTTIVVVPHR